MYFKDKTEIYKIRLTPVQSKYIERMAEIFGCSKSEIIRKFIESYRLGARSLEDK